MTSKNSKRLVADANILIRALMGQEAIRVFNSPGFEINIKNSDMELVRKFIPHLASKYQLDEKSLTLQLGMLPLIVVDDLKIATLVLKEEVSRWSDEKDFNVLPLKIYTTTELLRSIESAAVNSVASSSQSQRD